MAELTTATATETAAACCAPAAQETCCAPAEKAECCAPDSAHCGCAAGTHAPVPPGIREAVRAKYAALSALPARAATRATTRTRPTRTAAEVWGGALYYGEDDARAAPAAVAASLGCGVPTAVADLHAGETVLDLGCGAGADVLISAARVGPTGTAIGIDMTDEMLDLARANADQAGAENVQFVKGYLEELPLRDRRERRRCHLQLRDQPCRRQDHRPRERQHARAPSPGGRLAISDVDRTTPTWTRRPRRRTSPSGPGASPAP